MSLATRDHDLVELMDDPECDPRRLRATLRRFGMVNAMVSGWGAIYLRHIRPVLKSLDGPARILDLGCGGGDVTARLARRAARDGFAVSWLGVDPDERALEVAQQRGSSTVAFRHADSGELRRAGERFDIVLSNHVLHHLSPVERTEFAEDSRALSRGIVLHSDIARGRLAYGLYAIGITPLAPGTFLRTDGLRSIRRSYRPEELASALPGWRIETPGLFRVLAISDGYPISEVQTDA